MEQGKGYLLLYGRLNQVTLIQDWSNTLILFLLGLATSHSSLDHIQTFLVHSSFITAHQLIIHLTHCIPLAALLSMLFVDQQLPAWHLQTTCTSTDSPCIHEFEHGVLKACAAAMGSHLSTQPPIKSHYQNRMLFLIMGTRQPVCHQHSCPPTIKIVFEVSWNLDGSITIGENKQLTRIFN